MRFNTKLLHGRHKADMKIGATTIPIYQSTSFYHNSAEELERIFEGTGYGYIYTRINNPTIDYFEQRVALLENGVGAIACASGMAAITLAILNLMEQGDELVVNTGIFGDTYSLFNSLKDYGIKTKFAISAEPESFAKKLTGKTKLIFVETIGNPKMDVPNIKELAQLAHSHGIPLVVDNTVTTPYLLRPFDYGADIVIHSTSKLINGSGNSIGGIIVDRGRFSWPADKFPKLNKLSQTFGFLAYLAKLRKGLHRDIGACISPFNAFLNTIGLETLGLRMDRMCSNAMELAQFLSSHPGVSWVNYPGLPDNRYHDIAKVQFNNKYGVLLTFGVGSKTRAFKVINNLKYAYNLANIGDIRTLVIHPASTIYSSFSNEEKQLMGVTEDLIRVSVGVEDIEDLIEDFEQALKA